MKYAIGDMVVPKKDIRHGRHWDPYKIVGTLPNGKYVVEIDADYISGYSEHELISEKEANVIKAVQEAEQNKLDAEFESVRGQLANNLKQATELVKKSIALAGKAKKDFHDLKEECRPLFNALNEGGWTPSSIKC
jgi:hypothetical protein